ncbi:hypothetical protein PF008_g10087 [Phytophthora fragariae]|uniref:Uncharacterized protein n=1 Tax=Phytophthora fragariae TaxID=53985 RepID=A0A6G0RUW0_9STRA|nr:hypothetical protein PF008_g10087 [Phytophthora fragariae]
MPAAVIFYFMRVCGAGSLQEPTTTNTTPSSCALGFLLVRSSLSVT